jgi:RimJ/RimL family protein N-acetyltransferase
MNESITAMSPRLVVRKTLETDLDFVVMTEHNEDNKLYIIPWDKQRHQRALNNPDTLHFTIETPGYDRRIGYGIIAGLQNPHQSIELQRIVITDKGQGYGREALCILIEWAFQTRKVHRLWLDVKEFNHRARQLYESEGFQIEGTLRECLKSDEGNFESLILMSMLYNEYVAKSKTK